MSCGMGPTFVLDSRRQGPKKSSRGTASAFSFSLLLTCKSSLLTQLPYHVLPPIGPGGDPTQGEEGSAKGEGEGGGIPRSAEPLL